MLQHIVKGFVGWKTFRKGYLLFLGQYSHGGASQTKFRFNTWLRTFSPTLFSINLVEMPGWLIFGMRSSISS